MNILHLNSYYIDNHLYSYLYKKLDTECTQDVFIPIKKDRQPENEVTLPNTHLHFKKIIQPYHKFHFWGKIHVMLKSVTSSVDLSKVDFIHAHNLFNDGALAYKLYKKYDIDYIVAVRSTDTGLQYRLMKHRRPYIHKVLRNAKKIIFISEHYKEVLLAMMPAAVAAELEPKMQVIPNGIDKFWHDNVQVHPTKVQTKKLNLIYVGQIIPRKNLDLILNACQTIIAKGDYDLQLTIVGGKHVNHAEYYEAFLKKLPDYPFATYKGQIKDKQELLETYRAADVFIMPSANELFGLVYIEALSQGLRLIYANQSGIKPFLSNKNVGEGVDLAEPDTLRTAIEKLAANIDSYPIDSKIIEGFDWQQISSTYLYLYGK